MHDRVCAVQEVEAWVKGMSAVDESILAPQRAASDEDRTSEGIALKCAMMLIPLVCCRPFENCNDRVAYSVAQRFTDHNGFVFEATLSEVWRSSNTCVLRKSRGTRLRFG